SSLLWSRRSRRRARIDRTRPPARRPGPAAARPRAEDRPAACYATAVAKKPAETKAPGALTAEHRIVVLIPKAPFVQGEFTAQLKDALVAAHGAIDAFRFEGPAATAAAVLDECRTFGLMQEHKLVVVDQADQLVKEENRPLVERYAAAPCAGA